MIEEVVDDTDRSWRNYDMGQIKMKHPEGLKRRCLGPRNHVTNADLHVYCMNVSFILIKRYNCLH